MNPVINPIVSIKRALERRLATLSLPTAYESSTFNPVPNQLYLRVSFIISPPDDPVLGDKYYRERILFQVFVCDVLNKGTANAFTVAQQVRELFDKGFFANEDNVCINVISTPDIRSSIVTQDRLVVPVSIDILGEVWRG